MKKEGDVVLISGTASGKTLTFWIPMLYETGSITLLVTPLNLLGKQTADTLNRAGITALAVTGANASDRTVTVLVLFY
jgi:superfamily II DNA helicase RecQ